ncbi:calcium ion binding [Zea mays]|nr:calcium ion binding [Zea mays]
MPCKDVPQFSAQYQRGPSIKQCNFTTKIISRSTKLGEDGLVVHVQGVSRAELKQNANYPGAFLINRTASPLA